MKRRASSAARTVTEQSVFSKILLAVDSPEEGERSARLALSLAAQHGAELVVLHVAVSPVPIVPPLGAGAGIALVPGYFDTRNENEKRVSRWMNRIAWSAAERGVRMDLRIVKADRSVADHITRLAEDESVDLIITGTVARSVLERIIIGSVSSEVIRRAKCAVMVVP